MHKILIIDDEPDIINLYKFYLKDFDCDLVTLTRGVEAYLEVIDIKFDLIISDLKMPEMSGEEFLLEIFEGDNINTPVLVISGHLDDELIDKIRSYANGEVKFLNKPFAKEVFIEIITELTGLKKKAGVPSNTI